MICYSTRVIARNEAIPNQQSSYANPPCKVADCFAPRNDGLFFSFQNNQFPPKTSITAVAFNKHSSYSFSAMAW